jgi:hypothetical protein
MEVMKHWAIAAALLVAVSGFGIAPDVCAKNKPVKKAAAANDFATADGSCRAGLHNGKIYCILTGFDTAVVLSPDSWTGDEESKSWNRWLVDFDNNLYSNWVESQPGEGQETVLVRIANGAVTQTPAAFYPGDPANSDQAKFSAAISNSLDKTLKAASPMPHTHNPLKEINYALTFMSGTKAVPFYGREQLGFMAVLDDTAKNVDVYGRMKEGRAPGIQIISDRDGGKIQVTDAPAFLQKCREASF